MLKNVNLLWEVPLSAKEEGVGLVRTTTTDGEPARANKEP
jgi:hypothetical protein